MSANQHVILKQTLQLQISRRDNHLALQQRFLRLVEEKLMPRLEPVFDRLVGPDEWVELDELAIDLGCLAPQESDQIWLDKAFRVYVEALEQHLAKLNSRPV
ncbi:MAG TPA: contractile injection system tape measure protein, partial [Haliscomenobacter sp.]|uniref:contractile injection system tape measure protein n=1 Tax=Haliscomenobacter sp. TaxID=2717303 RepID=UPI002CAF61D1